LLVNTSILFIYLFALYLLEKNTAQRWIASFRK
jgi:hypothetical protein